MTGISGLLFGVAAYPIVWFSGGSIAALVLMAGLVLSIGVLALEVEHVPSSAHGKPPKGGRVESCDAGLPVAA